MCTSADGCAGSVGIGSAVEGQVSVVSIVSSQILKTFFLYSAKSLGENIDFGIAFRLGQDHRYQLL